MAVILGAAKRSAARLCSQQIAYVAWRALLGPVHARAEPDLMEVVPLRVLGADFGF